MQEELQIPQITQNQMELWLHNPTTHAYFTAIRYMIADSIEFTGNGGCLGESAEETHVSTLVQLEMRALLNLLLKPHAVLNHVNDSGKSYGLLEIEEDEDIQEGEGQGDSSTD